MYQPLIWLFADSGMLGDDARGLGAPFDAKDSKGLANALVDGMRRNVEFRGDLLGAQMLVDKDEAIELSRGEPADTRGHQVLPVRAVVITRRVVRSA